MPNCALDASSTDLFAVLVGFACIYVGLMVFVMTVFESLARHMRRDRVRMLA